MSYLVRVDFTREFWDDMEIVCGKKQFQLLPMKKALGEQLALELQEGYDKSEGALAGHYDVVEVFNVEVPDKDRPSLDRPVSEWRAWLCLNTDWQPPETDAKDEAVLALAEAAKACMEAGVDPMDSLQEMRKTLEEEVRGGN